MESRSSRQPSKPQSLSILNQIIRFNLNFFFQFIAFHESTIKAWDIRDSNQNTWTIEGAHKQMIRDIDCNPNKQFHLATCGDDGALKIWDSRNNRSPVFARNDHSHWYVTIVILWY